MIILNFTQVFFLYYYYYYYFLKYGQRQAEVNSHMLLLALLCYSLPMLFPYAGESADVGGGAGSLRLSRAGSIVMLVAYVAYLIFHLWTHRQLFEADKVCNRPTKFKMIGDFFCFVLRKWPSLSGTGRIRRRSGRRSGDWKMERNSVVGGCYPSHCFVI